MRKFKNILTEDELADTNIIKQYLEYSFDRRKKKKSMKLYTNLSLIYELYPDVIKEILDNIPTLGYYKDYFYILATTKNANMEEHIYILVIKQLKLDMINLENDKPISTLGKWLPREKSNLNKETGFVDKFNSLFFLDIKNKIMARREYRKIKTSINKKLGTIESKLCAKEYDSIEYDKVAPYALKQSMSILMNHEESQRGFYNYQLDKLKKKTLSEFVKELIRDKQTVNIEDLERIWQENKYIETIPHLDNIASTICVIDLSNAMYNAKGEFLAIGVALLIDQYSQMPKKIIIGNNTVVNLTGNIIAKTKQIMKRIGPCNPIDVEKYNFDNKIDKLVYVTTKEITYPKNNINILHIKPNCGAYDIIYNSCTTSVQNILTNSIVKLNKPNIQTIINNNFPIKKYWRYILTWILICGIGVCLLIVL